MGSKIRYLIIILLSYYTSSNGQEATRFRYIDSLTYSYYNAGEWNKLIKTGNDALARGIDYKFLRQRLGYAYFSTGDYKAAIHQFEKAMSYDSYNTFTLENLYYLYLYTGKEDYTGVFVSRLSPDARNNLHIRAFKPIESIGLEYDYKYAGASYRSNPQYYRFAIGSALRYRLSLIQSVSNYTQLITIPINGREVTISDKQPEYFALLKWNASDHLLIKTAYHYINSTSGTAMTSGNLCLLAIASDFNEFSLETYGSVMSLGQKVIYQAGVQAGYVFPGKLNFYVNGMASLLSREGSNRFIYCEKAGFKVTRRAWLEGNVTTGRLDGYNDYNGLYIYNSYDPMIFRTGALFTYFAGKNFAFWINYSFELKEVNENNSNHYNQFSYLGGIKWKL